MHAQVAPMAPSCRRALAAGVIVLVTWVAWPADASAATEPDPALVGQVPAALASTCEWASVDGIANAEAAVACTPPASSGVNRVTYLRFPNAEIAGSYYEDALPTDSDPDLDCADVLGASESPYHTSSGRHGRLACSTAHHVSSITWTDDAVVATATSKNDERLYAWWDELVGRTLTDAQRALLSELPAGIPRSMCRDNGEASLKCYPPYKFAGDVYVLYFTKYADKGAMNAAYDAILADNGLERELPPPTELARSCNYEVPWVQARKGAATAELGRLACYEEPVANDLLWTRDDNLVLARARGYTPRAIYRFFQKYSGGSQAMPPGGSDA